MSLSGVGFIYLFRIISLTSPDKLQILYVYTHSPDIQQLSLGSWVFKGRIGLLGYIHHHNYLCSFLDLIAMLRILPTRHGRMDSYLDTYNRMVTQLVLSQEHCVPKGLAREGLKM